MVEYLKVLMVEPLKGPSARGNPFVISQGFHEILSRSAVAPPRSESVPSRAAKLFISLKVPQHEHSVS
jgi:hypothetical protein